MKNIWLITQWEYLTRTRRKSFILLSVLSPFLFAALVMVPFWLTEDSGYKKDNKKNISVFDETGQYKDVFQNTGKYSFYYQDRNTSLHESGLTPDMPDAVLVIPEDLLKNPRGSYIYSFENFTEQDRTELEQLVKYFFKDHVLFSFATPEIEEKIKIITDDIHIKILNPESGEMGSGQVFSYAVFISVAGALLIYFFIFMYGVQVMHSVIEEKNNRIIEIILSSVKPFQVMAGKILGTLLVALTQFLIWTVFTTVLIFFIVPYVSAGGNTNEILTALPVVSATGWESTLWWFLCYFLAGYLLYSSLFAGIGAMIDSGTGSQQFVLPVTLPLFFAVYISLYSLQSPESSLVCWTSFIPFTSPVVMVSRLPFGVSSAELFLSLVLLAGTFLLTTWGAGRIYKSGILLSEKTSGYKGISKRIKKEK